jgi:hypothetical protein
MLRAYSRAHAVLGFVARTPQAAGLVVSEARARSAAGCHTTSGMLHLAAHTQCWASHCLHFRAAEEKQCGGKMQAAPPAASCGCGLLHINI